ncbi:MAG: DUF4157 domain-containing protein [Nodularia sp. CChRGM 3473]
MYSRRTRTFKTSSSDTPAPNQFAPRKFKVQPLSESVSPQQSTPDLQQQPEATPASESHFYKVSMSPQDLVQKEPNSHEMNLKIDANVRANIFGETVQPDVPDVQKKAEVANFTVSSPAYQPPRLQMKLTIGQPGDKYEQEADRVAADVVQQINAPQHSSVQREKMQDEEELQMKPMVQRVSDGGMAATPDLEASIQRAKGSGQPLSDNIRQPMEQAFGADFSGVKVHADAQSDELNQSIQAKAFTTGQDIFFRQGAYNPGTQGGQELIAHELTHVMQQSDGLVQRNSRKERIDKSEKQRVSPDEASKAVVQRDEREEELKNSTEEESGTSNEQKYSLPFISTKCEGWLKVKDVWEGGYIVVSEQEAKGLSWSSLFALKERRKRVAQSIKVLRGKVRGPLHLKAVEDSTRQNKLVGVNQEIDWEPLKAGQITLAFTEEFRRIPIHGHNDYSLGKPKVDEMW